MGVRIAMGAHARDITRLIVREGMTLVGAGDAIGLLASAVIARALSFLLYGVAPIDPLTLAAAVLKSEGYCDVGPLRPAALISSSFVTTRPSAG